jgi:hypothetical protein
MTITSIDDSQRKAARVAGFAYLFSLAIEVFHEFVFKPRLTIAGNPAAWLLFKGLLPSGMVEPDNAGSQASTRR